MLGTVSVEVVGQSTVNLNIFEINIDLYSLLGSVSSVETLQQ